MSYLNYITLRSVILKYKFAGGSLNVGNITRRFVWKKFLDSKACLFSFLIFTMLPSITFSDGWDP